MITADVLAGLKHDLQIDEGLRLQLYTDTVGKVSIGYGHNLTDRGISHAIADVLLDEDIAETINGIVSALPWAMSLDVPRFLVLANIGFNAGLDGLMRFHKMLAAVQKGDYVTAAAEIRNSHLAPRRRDRLAQVMESV